MGVLIWMRPSELGEQGYSIIVEEANRARPLPDGSLQLKWHEDDETDNVGRVAAGRWDLYVVLDDKENGGD